MRIDAHNHIGIESANYLAGHYPYAQSIEDLRAKASGTEVTHWLVFPFVSYPARSDHGASLCPPAEHRVPDVPYGTANQNLLDEVANLDAPARRRFLPVAILDPARGVPEQVRHLRSLLAKHRIYALKIQGTILQSKVTELLDGGRDFLDLAAEFDLPFLIHSSILPEDIWSQAPDILKVVEARPDLRFILAHSCRFHKPSLDRIAELPNAWFDCSAHRIHCELAENDSPAVAAKEERFASDYADPSAVLRDLAEAYPEKLIWGTDSPYYSWIENNGSIPERLVSSYRAEWDCAAHLPEPLKTAATRTNTLNWLGIDENRLQSQ